VVLVVDQSQIAAGRDRIWTLTSGDREEAIERVIDLLRRVDVLSARTDVDTTRIGIHGLATERPHVRRPRHSRRISKSCHRSIS